MSFVDEAVQTGNFDKRKFTTAEAIAHYEELRDKYDRSEKPMRTMSQMEDGATWYIITTSVSPMEHPRMQRIYEAMRDKFNELARKEGKPPIAYVKVMGVNEFLDKLRSPEFANKKFEGAIPKLSPDQQQAEEKKAGILDKFKVTTNDVTWPQHNKDLLQKGITLDELEPVRNDMLTIAKEMVHAHIAGTAMPLAGGVVNYGEVLNGLHNATLGRMAWLYQKFDPATAEGKVIDGDETISLAQQRARECFEAVCRSVGDEYRQRKSEFGVSRRAATSARSS